MLYLDPTLKPSDDVHLGCCDICEKKYNDGIVSEKSCSSKIDFGKEANMLLDAIKNVFHERTGFTTPIAFLRGSVNLATRFVEQSFRIKFMRVLKSTSYSVKERGSLSCGGASCSNF